MKNDQNQTLQDQNTVNPPQPSRVRLHPAKLALTVLCLLLCASLLLVTIWIGIDKFVRKSTVPSFAGYSILVVATGSMENSIMQGDLIIIRNTGDYKIGDIVTYAHEGEKIPTTHRITGYDDQANAYITRGDHNNVNDKQRVSEDEIFGEVVSVMHWAGLLLGWLTEAGGYIYLIAALLILAIGIYLFKDESNRHMYVGTEKKDDDQGETIDPKEKDEDRNNDQ